MAGFCGSCGFPLGASSTFCSKCGVRQAAANSLPPQPVTQPLSVPTGGSGFKILMVVLVCLGAAGFAAVAGVWYVAHRVKEAVVQKAEENGVDIKGIIPPKKTSFLPTRHRKACEYLSKEDASSLLGEPVERTEYQDSACLYIGPPGLGAKLGEEQSSNAIKKIQTPSPNGNDTAKTVDDLINGLGAATGQMSTGEETPLLILVIDYDGRPQMTALNASKALFGGIFKAADPKGKAGFATAIQGLGDQAVRFPKLGLNVLAGETFIRVVVGPVPDADPKSIAIARAVLKQL